MILIAGGTGHLGTEVVPRLTARGCRVRVLTRDLGVARKRLGDTPDFAKGDARDPTSLGPAMNGADTVVSAMTGFGPGGNGPRAVDLEGNLNLIRAAEAAGCRRFILVSMQAASAQHPLELLRMKHRAEEALRASQLQWAIVRPTVFMELWASIVGDPIAKSGRATVFGRGDNPINFISVRDVASFVELAVLNAGLTKQVLDVGGPENLTFNDMIRRIERVAGRTAKVTHVSVWVLRLAQLLMKPFRPDISRMMQAGIALDAMDMTFDASPLHERFPQVEVTHIGDVLDRQFTVNQAASEDTVDKAPNWRARAAALAWAAGSSDDMKVGPGKVVTEAGERFLG